MTTHLFGIRHHGPGGARSLLAALDALSPDAVLVEGPPDADETLPLVLNPAMKPPVALLVYPVERPAEAVYYPFASFSPEWHALTWALRRGVPARFIDLPQSIQRALEAPKDAAATPEPGGDEPPPGERDVAGADALPEAGADDDGELPEDPIGALAEAAGYTDRELWWERMVEQRRDPAGLFDGIREAMTELRASAPEPPRRERLREAYMRGKVRAAEKEGFERIAVVCGAWHVPALAARPTVKSDQELLKDLPKTKVAATWIPWTHSRLSTRSGYGAGVESPGWYRHLFETPHDAPLRWIAEAARLLREADLDASSASVIEAVRLADALAALRGLPMPGLPELREAVRTVLCHGEASPMALVRDKLEIGERLGEVPEETPAVPLQKDLEAHQRRLRLKPTAEIRALDLDLRQENDRDRSRLLHRLRLLGIGWGTPEAVSGKAGTFHETWRLQWRPELAVAIVEANVWGSTIEAAATGRACDEGRRATALAALTALLDRTILAELPAAVERLLAELQARAAVSSDVLHLMEALPPLARAARYGDVRGTDARAVLPILEGLFERVVIGLPRASGNVDDDAAAAILEGIRGVQGSVDLLDRPVLTGEWRELLRKLLDDGALHGLVRGHACRLLVDQGALGADELTARARLALAPALPPREAAAWAEGLLRGSGLALLHHDGLWSALDGWLRELSTETFTELLPLLRRALAAFTAPERRQMGEKVKRLGRPGEAPALAAEEGWTLDPERALRVVPVLAHLLGVPVPDGGGGA